MRAILAPVAAAVALSCASPAVPASQPDFFAQWSIDPIPAIEGKTVSKGTEIAQATMLPATMYVLEEDYLQDKGNMAAPKGTELVGLVTEGLGACAIFAPDLAGIASIASWGADRHLCLLDRDDDGVFDHYFHRQDSQGGFFNMFSTWPGKLKIGQGGRFRKADPHSFSRPMIWHFTLDSCNLAKARCRVSSELSIPGWGKHSFGVYTILYGRQDELKLVNGAADWEILGARFRVKALSDTSAEFTLVQNFPGAPFVLR